MCEFVHYLWQRWELISTYDSASPCLGTMRCKIIAIDKIRMQQSAPAAGEDGGNAYLMGLSNWILNSPIGKEENIYTTDIAISGSCMAWLLDTVINKMYKH